ncbi:MAG TPA: GxxExxY protein [Vicinamibacterales bacterium]
MDEPLDPVTGRIIGCAITLHRFLGPGLLESVYHTGLAIEMARAEIPFESKRLVEIQYHGVKLGEFYPDFIVENEVVVEINGASSHGVKSFLCVPVATSVAAARCVQVISVTLAG